MSCELRFVALTLGGFLSLGACGDATADAETCAVADVTPLVDQHQAIRDRAAIKLARAAFISPEDNSTVGDRVWMAPLVIHESAPKSRSEAPFPRFGAIIVRRSQLASIDSGRPTIYVASTRIQVGPSRYEQQTYIWFYPPKSPGGPLRWRGFRQTLDKQGFAFVWEALASEESMRVFYVSKSLEEAAAKQFGPPLPGRRFSAETNIKDLPNTIVARVVREGPQPMGPFVYLDRAALRITTMKCRCEPSQVGRFSESVRYRLVPLKSFADLLPGDTRPQNLHLPDDSAGLDGVLRLSENL